MKILLAVFLLISSQAFAKAKKVKEKPLKEGDVIVAKGNVTGLDCVSGTNYLKNYKADFKVTKTIKGKKQKNLEFFFEEPPTPEGATALANDRGTITAVWKEGRWVLQKFKRTVVSQTNLPMCAVGPMKSR